MRLFMRYIMHVDPYLGPWIPTEHEGALRKSYGCPMCNLNVSSLSALFPCMHIHTMVPPPR